MGLDRRRPAHIASGRNIDIRPHRLPEIGQKVGRALSAFKRELHGDDDSEGGISS
jgi:hypothetical protein